MTDTIGLNGYLDSVGTFLREREVLIDDPHSLHNLAPLEKLGQVPANVAMQSFYVVPKNQRIFCHLCGAYRHFRGMVGRCDDGTAILFGSHCAKKYFGKDTWTRIEQKRRALFERATQEHRGFWIHKHIKPVDAWLNQHMNLIESIRKAWSTLLIDHSEMTNELLEHLKKHRGRLIEEQTQEIGSAARSAGFRDRYLTTTRIVLSLPNSSGIDNIAAIDSDITSVRLLCKTVLSISNPTVSDFSRWDHHLTMNVRRGAENIDSFLQFSVALFAEGKLEVCGKWLDDRRRTRLGSDHISHRDAAKLLRKKVGHGYERPTASLVSTLPDFSLSHTLRSIDLRKIAAG